MVPLEHIKDLRLIIPIFFPREEIGNTGSMQVFLFKYRCYPNLAAVKGILYCKPCAGKRSAQLLFVARCIPSYLLPVSQVSI